MRPPQAIDAVSVAEASTEVLSHTGLPKELLTDQDSVFTEALAKQTHALLGIKKLRTTAYHPQTNGI